MGGTQLERALSLIDANLLRNREEVLRYISENEASVAQSLRTNGRAEIPTSAGIVIIRREQLADLAA